MIVCIMKIRVFNHIFFGLVLFVFFAVPVSSYAASIYFAPSSGSYKVGEQFSVNIFVSSDGQDINAAEATIASIDGNLQLVSVSQAGSIIDFWAREPQINGGGTMHFEGVLLGGGYSGSAGKLATVILRASSVGDAALSVISGSILANDGQGTELPTNLGTAHFTITSSTVPKKEEEVPGSFIFSKDLRQGDRDNEVSYLQICLRDQEFYDKDITDYFGTFTRQAVVDFQEKYRDDVLAPGGFSQGTGQVGESTRKKLNEVCFGPLQLFDISFGIESVSLAKSNDLESITTFENFGRVPTPVELTYIIVNKDGQTVFKDTETIVVETENIVRKTFENLSLSSGTYTIVLETLYNTDVVDEFSADFIVEQKVERERIYNNIWFWIITTAVLAVIIILLLIIIIVLLLRQTREHRQLRHKQALNKKEAVLRRAHENLLLNKTKIEKELQKAENELKKFSKEYSP